MAAGESQARLLLTIWYNCSLSMIDCQEGYMSIYRAILGTLLLALSTATNGIGQQGGFPFEGETTSRVNVRKGDAVVWTLDKGARVNVVGEDSPEWYIIGTGMRYKVAAKYIRRIPPVSAPPTPSQPINGWRMFYVLVPYPKDIGGVKYPDMTAFDVLRQDETTATIVGPGGKDVVIDKNSMHLSAVPWDYARNIPRPDSDNTLQSYYHSITTMLTHPWFAILLILLLTIYAAFAALGSDGDLKIAFTVFLALLAFLAIGAQVGSAHLRYLETYERTAQWLAPYRLPNGHLLPVDYRTIDPTDRAEWARGMWYSLPLILWVPFFLLAHILIAYYLPSTIRGAHFFFIRHPAEKHVTVMGPVGQLTRNIAGALRARRDRGWLWIVIPPFVLRNYERRLKAKKDYLKAERELLEHAVEVDRMKAEFEKRRRGNA
jgi:hypothetical protein